MRLFVAVDIGDPARQAIAAEQRRLAPILGGGRSSLKWVRTEHIHLTLAFLGEVEAPRVDPIVAALAEPIDAQAPFDVVFGGVGVFPPHGAPRVLWLGVSSGAREVIASARVVGERLAELGFLPEERPFHPHLTLGRWRDARPRDRDRVAAAGCPEAVARVHVEAVTLYQSRLSSSGPTYTPLVRGSLR